MRDIYLDPATHDIFLENEELVLIDKQDEATRQRLVILLKAFKGEWFANTEFGVPYLKNETNNIELLGKGLKDILDLNIRDFIVKTEGIVELISYSSVLDEVTRELTITFSASTTNESIISLSVEI